MFVDRDEEGEREGWFGLFLEAISETIAAPGGGRGNRKVSVPRDCSSLLLSDLHTPASPLLFRCAEVFRFSGEAQVKFFASRIGNIPRCIHFLVFQDDGLISTARNSRCREFHGEGEAGNSNGSRPRKLADSSLCLANFTTSGTKAPFPRNKKSNHGLLTSPRNFSLDARRIDSRIFFCSCPPSKPAIKTCPFRSFVPFKMRRIDASSFRR